MIPAPPAYGYWLAVGRTDMRRRVNGLALQVQEALQRDPHLCVGRDYVASPGIGTIRSLRPLPRRSTCGRGRSNWKIAGIEANRLRYPCASACQEQQ